MFSVADVRCYNEILNLANVSVPHSKHSLLTRLNSHVQIIVYAPSNDIHNRVTIVLLSQQLFTVLYFLIKFTTLGLMFELDLPTKLCAKPCLVNDGSFFEMSFR